MSTNATINTSQDSDGTTTRRIASAAHEAIDSAAESAEKMELKVRQGAADAGERIEKTHDAASQQVKDSISSLERFVRNRPVAAAGVAFMAGALATAILRR